MCQNKYATAPKTAEPTMMPAIGALLPVFIKWIFHGQRFLILNNLFVF
jgi:hypothetical protein